MDSKTFLEAVEKLQTELRQKSAIIADQAEEARGLREALEDAEKAREYHKGVADTARISAMEARKGWQKEVERARMHEQNWQAVVERKQVLEQELQQLSALPAKLSKCRAERNALRARLEVRPDAEVAEVLTEPPGPSLEAKEVAAEMARGPILQQWQREVCPRCGRLYSDPEHTCRAWEIGEMFWGLARCAVMDAKFSRLHGWLRVQDAKNITVRIESELVAGRGTGSGLFDAMAAAADDALDRVTAVASKLETEGLGDEE